jgi:hypothetical protein
MITMRVALWSAVALLPLAPLASCLQISTDTGDGTSGSTGSSGASGSTAASGGTGIDCTTDPATGVVLCAQLSTCAGVSVDPSALAGCGFRTGGAAIDLECLCSGSLCPIGVPTTCAEAAQMIGAQTVLQVCQQVAAGLCVPVEAPDAGATVAPGCDRNCQNQCGSAADCLQLCGC